MIFLGRQTKNAPKSPFIWCKRPGIYEPNVEFDGQIIPELIHEKSISFLFKKIISFDMIRIITYYTKKRIENRITSKYVNLQYRERLDKIKANNVSEKEIYAYIGLLILFGLTNKNDISIELLWSAKSLVHYTPFASAIIAVHLPFDNNSSLNLSEFLLSLDVIRELFLFYSVK